MCLWGILICVCVNFFNFNSSRTLMHLLYCFFVNWPIPGLGNPSPPSAKSAPKVKNAELLHKQFQSLFDCETSAASETAEVSQSSKDMPHFHNLGMCQLPKGVADDRVEKEGKKPEEASKKDDKEYLEFLAWRNRKSAISEVEKLAEKKKEGQKAETKPTATKGGKGSGKGPCPFLAPVEPEAKRHKKC